MVSGGGPVSIEYGCQTRIRKEPTAVKKPYHIVTRTARESAVVIEQFCQANGQILLPIVNTPGTTTLLSRIPGTVQPQTGDSYARLGSPAGSSVSADVASLKTDLDGGVKVSVGTGAGQINASGGKVPATLVATDVTGSMPAQVKGQDNIDFGALQKASLNAATPAVTVSDKTGFSLSAGYQATLVTAVWAAASRTLTGFGTLVADIVTAVWGAVARTLTDKAGFALTPAYDAAKTAGDATAVNQEVILAAMPPPADNLSIAAIKAKTEPGRTVRSRPVPRRAGRGGPV